MEAFWVIMAKIGIVILALFGGAIIVAVEIAIPLLIFYGIHRIWRKTLSSFGYCRKCGAKIVTLSSSPQLCDKCASKEHP